MGAVIAMSLKEHPHVNYIGAKLLMIWLLGEEAQEIIRIYQIQGESLFYTYGNSP